MIMIHRISFLLIPSNLSHVKYPEHNHAFQVVINSPRSIHLLDYCYFCGRINES